MENSDQFRVLTWSPKSVVWLLDVFFFFFGQTGFWCRCTSAGTLRQQPVAKKTFWAAAADDDDSKAAALIILLFVLRSRCLPSSVLSSGRCLLCCHRPQLDSLQALVALSFLVLDDWKDPSFFQRCDGFFVRGRRLRIFLSRFRRWTQLCCQSNCAFDSELAQVWFRQGFNYWFDCTLFELWERQLYLAVRIFLKY